MTNPIVNVRVKIGFASETDWFNAGQIIPLPLDAAMRLIERGLVELFENTTAHQPKMETK